MVCEFIVAGTTKERLKKTYQHTTNNYLLVKSLRKKKGKNNQLMKKKQQNHYLESQSHGNRSFLIINHFHLLKSNYIILHKECL